MLQNQVETVPNQESLHARTYFQSGYIYAKLSLLILKFLPRISKLWFNLPPNTKIEDKNEASHSKNHKLEPPKRTSLKTTKQIACLLVLKMKSKDGNKCKIVFMSIFVSLRDVNNRMVRLFDSNFQKELDMVDHGLGEDGAF
jgi:hypothetical protein